MKMRKAIGLDQTSNEMIKYGFHFLKDPSLKLFNLILEAQIVPTDWCKGLIPPIFKLDDKMNPDNYVAICIVSCLSKLSFLILNDRLSCFLKSNNIIDRSQIGFQKGHRPSDHIFTLKTLINKHVYSTPRGNCLLVSLT